MKVTQYFLATRQRDDRKDIALEWIEAVLAQPTHRHMQADGRLRLWAPIAACEGRYLRVVVLEDGVTVHNAFFDRGFKP